MHCRNSHSSFPSRHDAESFAGLWIANLNFIFHDVELHPVLDALL